MTSFTRTDTSMLGRWWWTVDRWTLAAVAMLVGFGILLTLAASPSAPTSGQPSRVAFSALRWWCSSFP